MGDYFHYGFFSGNFPGGKIFYKTTRTRFWHVFGISSMNIADKRQILWYRFSLERYETNAGDGKRVNVFVEWWWSTHCRRHCFFVAVFASRNSSTSLHYISFHLLLLFCASQCCCCYFRVRCPAFAHSIYPFAFPFVELTNILVGYL